MESNMLNEEDANEIEVHLREINAKATNYHVPAPVAVWLRAEVHAIRAILKKVLVPVDATNPIEHRLTRASRLSAFAKQGDSNDKTTTD